MADVNPCGVCDVKLILRPGGVREDAPWTPAYLEQSATDARRFLNECQYQHAVQLVLSLCEEDNPSHPSFVNVDAVDEFHELRDKHGVLGKINLRIFFWICKPHRLIVVLGACKKTAEGKTPVRLVKRFKWRKRYAEQSVIQYYKQKELQAKR